MRSYELAQKLTLPENTQLLSQLPVLASEADAYAERMLEEFGIRNDFPCKEGYQFYYLLSHVCPSLYHFQCRPDPWEGEVNKEQLLQYIKENSPDTFYNESGGIEQYGVEYTKESYDAFWSVIHGNNNKDAEKRGNDAEIKQE